MNLMQTILDEIKQEAAEKARTALGHTGLIYEAEILAYQLQSAGLADAKPAFIPSAGGKAQVIFYDYGRNGEMRAALAACGIEIEREAVATSILDTPNTRTVRLALKGLSCEVWICRDPIPLAEAA